MSSSSVGRRVEGKPPSPHTLPPHISFLSQTLNSQTYSLSQAQGLSSTELLQLAKSKSQSQLSRQAAVNTPVLSHSRSIRRKPVALPSPEPSPSLPLPPLPVTSTPFASPPAASPSSRTSQLSEIDASEESPTSRTARQSTRLSLAFHDGAEGDTEGSWAEGLLTAALGTGFSFRAEQDRCMTPPRPSNGLVDRQRSQTTPSQPDSKAWSPCSSPQARSPATFGPTTPSATAISILPSPPYTLPPGHRSPSTSIPSPASHLRANTSPSSFILSNAYRSPPSRQHLGANPIRFDPASSPPASSSSSSPPLESPPHRSPLLISPTKPKPSLYAAPKSPTSSAVPFGRASAFPLSSSFGSLSKQLGAEEESSSISLPSSVVVEDLQQQQPLNSSEHEDLAREEEKGGFACEDGPSGKRQQTLVNGSAPFDPYLSHDVSVDNLTDLPLPLVTHSSPALPETTISRPSSYHTANSEEVTDDASLEPNHRLSSTTTATTTSSRVTSLSPSVISSIDRFSTEDAVISRAVYVPASGNSPASSPVIGTSRTLTRSVKPIHLKLRKPTTTDIMTGSPPNSSPISPHLALIPCSFDQHTTDSRDSLPISSPASPSRAHPLSNMPSLNQTSDNDDGDSDDDASQFDSPLLDEAKFALSDAVRRLGSMDSFPHILGTSSSLTTSPTHSSAPSGDRMGQHGSSGGGGRWWPESQPPTPAISEFAYEFGVRQEEGESAFGRGDGTMGPGGQN